MGNRTWRDKLNSVAPEYVDIELQSGMTLKDVRAYVISNPEEIIVPKKFCSEDLDAGDIIVRKLPSREDRLIIVEPGYKPEFNPEQSDGYIAHFAVRWKRALAIEESVLPTNHITYNLHGPNTRVNNNSVDFSANLAQADPWADPRLKLQLLYSEVQHIRDAARQMFIPDEEIEIRVSINAFELNVFEAALLDTFCFIAQEAELVNDIDWLRQTCKTVNNKLKQYLHDRSAPMTSEQSRALTKSQNLTSRLYCGQIVEYCSRIIRSFERVSDSQSG